MERKLSIVLIIISFSLVLPFVSLAQNAPQISNLQTLVQQLQEQVKALQEQVISLQTQLKTTKEEVAEVKTELKITRSLQRGATGDEVKQLQEFLKQFPDIYPEGLVTGYFGPRTEVAVRKLQERQGIQSIGIVGPKTLTKINELITQGAGASGVIPPGLLTAPGIQAKLATSTPVAISTTPAVIPSTTPTSTSLGTSTITTSTMGVAPIQPIAAAPTASTQTTTTTSTATSTSTTSGSTVPVISSIVVHAYVTTTTFTWTTDKPANTEIWYSTTYSGNSASGKTYALGSWDLNTSHLQILLGLLPNTTYYYVVVSKLAGGNGSQSNEQSFTTLSSSAGSATSTATTTVATTDTTPPTISTVYASGTLATTSAIYWNTNEVANSEVQYGTSVSYEYTSGADAYYVTFHTVWLTSLQANTTYHYRIKSKDAMGNLAISGDYMFTTPVVVASSASIPAPLSMRWNWFGRITLPTTILFYHLIFYYPPNAIDAPASFNIYLKKPGESDFTKINYPKSSLTKYVASSGGEAAYSAYPLGNYGVPSSDIPLGEYKVYATAVDSAGMETVPTPTATGNYNPAPLIVNPASGSTQSSLTQIDLSNLSSLANPRYTVSLFGANGYIWTPNAFYGSSVTYSGPALSSANNPHTLVASIFPGAIDPADSSPYTISTFNIESSATTTTSAAPHNSLASTLASLSQLLQQITRLLSP